jgi:FAD/FMN-containing dehydrogenase
MTAPEPAAVVRELAELLGSDTVLTEAHERERYEKGWRYGAGRALAVVRPRRTEEVSRVLAFAFARGLRVLAQGANTGLVGGSTPDASGEMLVLSLERLSSPLEIDEVDRTVTAGGGVRLSQLDAALAEKGLLFPIDLGADPTVGGMVATNAAGTRVLRYGDVRQNLLGLEVVLADGTVLDLTTALRKNNTGLDLKQLFVGTAGVFGVVTRAVVRVVPRPAQRSTALVGVASGEAALRLLFQLEQALGDVLRLRSGERRGRPSSATSRGCRPFGAKLPPTPSCGAVDDARRRAPGPRRPAGVGPRRLPRARAARNHRLTRANQPSCGTSATTSPNHRHGRGARVRHQRARSSWRSSWTRGGSWPRAIPSSRVCDFGHWGDGGVHLNLVGGGRAEAGGS